MTTYARKIAEAVRDAAASVCEKTEDRYAEENRFKFPELQESAETGARDCEHAVKTLDLDAIIAGVAKPALCATAIESNAFRRGWMAAKSRNCQLCGGTGVVADGQITGDGGMEFESGPITCAKDCPNCFSPQPQEAEPKGLTDEQIRNTLGLYGALPLKDGSPDEIIEGRTQILVAAIRTLLAKGE